MDRDTAMLAAAAGPDGPDRLERVFEWGGPALSLGRSNRDAGLNRDLLARAGIEVVRRPTGGGALLHGTDISYSVAVRRMRGGGEPDVIAAGRELAAPVRRALHRLGIGAEFRDCAACGGPDRPDALPLCFAQRTPLDLVVAGRKVAAFALRRTAGALLLHGSVLVEPPADVVVEALAAAGTAGGAAWTAALAGTAAVGPLAGVSRAALREALAAA